MSDVVIQVDHLWKKYRLGVLGTGTLRHDFNRWLHRTLGKPDPYAVVGHEAKAEKLKTEKLKSEKDVSISTSASQDVSISAFQRVSVSEASLRDDEMWALRDISFEVKQGEILGIIGRNGAGKSTLLKILSRVTAPTSGEIRVKGRIASLLEVGTGFHPELTGRENIFLNGAILGMTKAEIKGKFDEIVAFSEVEKHIDTPVKRYSSGMYVRLAFAVAAHLEPEILIVDEVLAVGDAQFQRKCLGKMDEVARGGRTVLFVSHNMQAVRQLCQKCVWLETATLRQLELTSEVVQRYLAEEHSTEKTIVVLPKADDHEPVHLTGARLLADGMQGATIYNGSHITFEAAIRLRKVVDLSFCMPVFREGELVFLANSYHKFNDLQLDKPGSYVIRFVIPPHLLNPGSHTAGFYVADSQGTKLHYVRTQKLLSFQVVDDGCRRGGLFAGSWPGPTCPILDVKAEYTGEQQPEWLTPPSQKNLPGTPAVASA